MGTDNDRDKDVADNDRDTDGKNRFKRTVWLSRRPPIRYAGGRRKGTIYGHIPPHPGHDGGLD
jgi:hypothetical protein